jgi:hypothetical protein
MPPKLPLPQWIPPQLTQLVEAAPSGPKWLHEIKLDGFRMAGRIERGRAKLLTRTGLDWSAKYPSALTALAAVRAKTAYLDGQRALYQRPRRLTHLGDSLAPDYLTPLAREDSRHAFSGQIARGLFGGGETEAFSPGEFVREFQGFDRQGRFAERSSSTRTSPKRTESWGPS